MSYHTGSVAAVPTANGTITLDVTIDGTEAIAYACDGVDVEVADIFDEDPATLWRRVLRRQPGSLGWVSTYPVDPDLN